MASSDHRLVVSSIRITPGAGACQAFRLQPKGSRSRAWTA